MSEWHTYMQSQFNIEDREVIITHNGVTHRANILKDGIVVEFQYSSISTEEFRDRNDFYTSDGYRIAWVFDFTKKFRNGSIYTKYDNDNLKIWKRPSQILRYAPSISDRNTDKVLIWFYTPYSEEELAMQIDINNEPFENLKIKLGSVAMADRDWWSSRGFEIGEAGFRTQANLLEQVHSNVYYVDKYKDNRVHTEFTCGSNSDIIKVYSSNMHLWLEDDKKYNTVVLDESSKINIFDSVIQHIILDSETIKNEGVLINLSKGLEDCWLAIDRYGSVHISYYEDYLIKHLDYVRKRAFFNLEPAVSLERLIPNNNK